MAQISFTPSELYDAWPVLSVDERVEGFEFLQRDDTDDFFLVCGCNGFDHLFHGRLRLFCGARCCS